MNNSATSPTDTVDKPGPRSVSEVSQLIQGRLKSDPQLANVTIIGEVSGHAQPASGHSYFSLRDREASLRCVMFRYGRGHQFLEDGALVVCEGSTGIYAPRGDLQIVVTSAEPAGVGDQQAQLEELRRKLRAEGSVRSLAKALDPAVPKTHRRRHIITRRRLARHRKHRQPPIPPNGALTSPIRGAR